MFKSTLFLLLKYMMVWTLCAGFRGIFLNFFEPASSAPLFGIDPFSNKLRIQEPLFIYLFVCSSSFLRLNTVSLRG
jgi:hypothetical protein